MIINKIYCEDCLKTLVRMPADFLDLTVTSPPYDSIRSYGGFSFDFNKIAQELLRSTKPGGVIVWIVNDQVINGSESGTSFKQALYFKEIGFNIHDTMIYQKKNFSNPEKIRYHSIFEYMFILSKGKPKTFNPIKDRKNISAGKIGSLGENTVTQCDGSKLIREKKINSEFGMRYNIWVGNTRGQEEMCTKLPHPAMMPRWLARDHILSWSKEGDLVYDPFSGSGTVASEACRMNRQFIGSEINPNYFQEIKEVK